VVGGVRVGTEGVTRGLGGKGVVLWEMGGRGGEWVRWGVLRGGGQRGVG